MHFEHRSRRGQLQRALCAELTWDKHGAWKAAVLTVSWRLLIHAVPIACIVLYGLQRGGEADRKARASRGLAIGCMCLCMWWCV